MARIIEKSLISILKNNRDEINKRVEKARQHFPGLDLNAVKYGFKNVFEPLIKAVENIRPDQTGFVFSVVLDIFLLAVAKRYYSLPEKRFTQTRLELLFEKLLPSLPEIVAESPTNFIGKLFNAGENLREKAQEFYTNLVKISDFITLKNISEIGQVIAWTVGESRLRKHSLRLLEKLPPEFCIKLANIGDIPKSKIEEVAQYIILALKSDKWRKINNPFSPSFIEFLQNDKKITQELINKETGTINFSDKRPLVLFNDVGDYIGFKGNFSSPPRLIWGPNGTVIAYTAQGQIVFLNIDGNGYREKAVRPRDFQILAYNPKVGFVGVTQKGDIINFTTLKKYNETIKGSRIMFNYCTSFSSSEFIYILYKDKELYKVDSENVEKFVLAKNITDLTITSDDKLFTIRYESKDKSKGSYYISELSLDDNFKNIMNIKTDGHLSIKHPFVYIFKEPETLYIYNLENKTLINTHKLPIKMRKCSSFLINEREMFITQKYSHHVICLGTNPYLS